MSIPLFLAMTSSEFSTCTQPPHSIAWLALHFSMSGPGLSNRPRRLPPGSLLILDDRSPWADHSIEVVCKELVALLLDCQAYGLLLDFERPPTEATLLLVQALCQCCSELNVPLAAPSAYLKRCNAIHFISPIPFQQMPDKSDSVTFWLDASPAALEVLITEGNAVSREIFVPSSEVIAAEHCFYSEILRCHYFSKAVPGGICLTLFRTAKSIRQMLSCEQAAPFQLAVGLWKEFA